MSTKMVAVNVRKRVGQERTVHGETPKGAEIVRYDVAGKWFFVMGNVRRQVKVREAAKAAALGKHYSGRPGGLVFDRLVQEYRYE